jgi:RNA ligase
LPFNVFEKIDGSSGILYWLNDNPYIATRGSFESEQAKHANDVLHSRNQHVFDKLDKKETYLFEIIYHQNRIVVDYGTVDDLIMLTIIDKNKGVERIEYIGFPIIKSYDGTDDYLQLKQLEQENKEGFVIQFANGLRVKIIFAEYVKLHRIITSVSNIAIWEYLGEGKSFEDLFEKVPDEFYNWVKQVQRDIYL